MLSHDCTEVCEDQFGGKLKSNICDIMTGIGSIVITGKRGMGKTNLGYVLASELEKQEDTHLVILDTNNSGYTAYRDNCSVFVGNALCNMAFDLYVKNTIDRISLLLESNCYSYKEYNEKHTNSKMIERIIILDGMLKDSAKNIEMMYRVSSTVGVHMVIMTEPEDTVLSMLGNYVFTEVGKLEDVCTGEVYGVPLAK